jgi:hypothetical protein
MRALRACASLLALCAAAAQSAVGGDVESTLKSRLQAPIAQHPCVRLLRAHGDAGCSACGAAALPFRLRRHRERALLRFPLRRPVVRAFAGTGADGITGLLVRVSTEEEFTAFTRLPATAAGGSPARAALLDPALLDLAHLSQLAALPFFAGALVPVLDGGAWLPRLTRARAGGRAGAVPPHASL